MDNLKRSGDLGPEVGGTTPEGTLALVSNLLLVVVNIGSDTLRNLTKLNIELKLIILSLILSYKKYWVDLGEFLY